MNRTNFLFGFLLLLSLTSCCGLDMGYNNNYNDVLYTRRIKVLDTADRILKISYKNSDKVFYPNDTATELIISENKETTLYINTKNEIDTIVLAVQIIYGMYNSACDASNTSRFVVQKPFIVNHTFDSANLIFEQTKNTFTDILLFKP